MFDIELNSFDNTQKGTVINWNVFKMIPMLPSIKMSVLDPWIQMATSSACMKLSTAGFAIPFQHNVPATQTSLRERPSNIQVFTGFKKKNQW